MFYEYNAYDHQGKQVLHHVAEKKSRLGKGWIAMFKRQLINSLLSLTELQLKVMLLLAAKQTYEPFIVITPLKIAEILHYSYSRVTTALTALINLNFIKRIRVDGVQVFVMNPDMSLCGTSTMPKRREIWALLIRREEAKAAIERLSNKETSVIQQKDLHFARESLKAIEDALKNALDNRDVDRNDDYAAMVVDTDTGAIGAFINREENQDETGDHRIED